MTRAVKQGIIYGCLSILFLALLIYITVSQGPQITELVKKPAEFKGYLNSFGILGVLVFMGLQILQVVVTPIPGELMQLAGGYVYGTWIGTFYSLAAISIGSMAAFFIARFLGYPVLRLFVSKDTIKKYDFIMNTPRADIVLFILFLIPGLPKDVMSYLAGLTTFKPGKFFLITAAARLPGILMSSYIGANLQKQNMTEVIIATVIVVVFFLLAVLYREKLLVWAHRISSRS